MARMRRWAHGPSPSSHYKPQLRREYLPASDCKVSEFEKDDLIVGAYLNASARSPWIAYTSKVYEHEQHRYTSNSLE